MSHDRYFSSCDLVNVDEIDEQAIAIAGRLDWALATFIAVFEPSLKRVLMVQLGDYAFERYGGHPWTLPGGAVEPNEAPSTGACRELKEETGVKCSRSSLQLAAWFPRPYFQPRGRERAGELLLLWGAISEENPDMHPTPPETVDVRYLDFDPDRWLKIPATGTGPNSLQPLPRHWTFWSSIVRQRLRHGPKSVFRHLYSTASELAIPPWAGDDAHLYLS